MICGEFCRSFGLTFSTSINNPKLIVPKADISESNRKKLDEAVGRADEGFIEVDEEIEPAETVGEDDELLILSPLSDDFDEEVQEAQEQLLHLRHQQEQLEKQKAELQELKRKREKFLRGRQTGGAQRRVCA